MARNPKGDPIHGWLIIDKPLGVTSSSIVSRVRRLYGAAKAGHGGTLDPMATGLMVLCVGSFTRLNPWLTRVDKTYEATLRLGATSNTDDEEGLINNTTGVVPPDLAQVERVLGPRRQPDHRGAGADQQSPFGSDRAAAGGHQTLHVLHRLGRREPREEGAPG